MLKNQSGSLTTDPNSLRLTEISKVDAEKMINNREYPVLLQKAPVKIIDTNTCNSPEAYNGLILDTMMCAGYMKGNIDACQGDSGGPLVYPNSRSIWYLVGIVSWGVDCGKINKPGVYTRVTSYRNWIASKTGI
ncbi:Transmembrane protease serine 11B [Tupaia chinensis]|uniref:Transmembrane protease serine 11B n=1 Tax=Tupaia chinensis TaxID=246437 RepID=L8YCS6_TUPCH|nr:Transmembrane protease serine 11B [Tupaia chinensis]